MKKKSLFRIAVCTITAVSLVFTLNMNFNANSSDLSEVALTNVEALASNEGGKCDYYGPKIAIDDIYSGGYEFYCSEENNYCCSE